MSTLDPSSPQILSADWLVVDGHTALRGGGVLVAHGRIQEVLASPVGVRAACRRHDLQAQGGAGILAPGWVNAHAHLELSHLVGELPRGTDFWTWVRALMKAKESTPSSQWDRSVRTGARRLLETGTTCVGDIDSVGTGPIPLSEVGLPGVHFSEILDAHDPARVQSARKSVRALRHKEEDASKILRGLAPHAGFTVSPTVLREVGAWAQASHGPVTIHWAETHEEVQWMRTGQGPMADWLGPSPMAGSLEVFGQAGLLRPGTSLVHGNVPDPGDWQLIAAAGASVVHCPGSHGFFERPPFPMQDALDAGVCVALGTDSWASNDDLHMGQEVRRLRGAFPFLSAREAFRMGTEWGARALGLQADTGRLDVGLCADAVRYSVQARDESAVFEALTEAPEVAELWVRGASLAGEDLRLGQEPSDP